VGGLRCAHVGRSLAGGRQTVGVETGLGCKISRNSAGTADQTGSWTGRRSQARHSALRQMTAPPSLVRPVAVSHLHPPFDTSRRLQPTTPLSAETAALVALA